jgi:hypothetical protein
MGDVCAFSPRFEINGMVLIISIFQTEKFIDLIFTYCQDQYRKRGAKVRRVDDFFDYLLKTVA